jgi:Protein of unknown function (Ytp1)
MFWFAGLLGMAIESKRIRTWLASTSREAVKSTFSSLDKEQPLKQSSYSPCFNPFPALVIGVTGVAMAAHSQTFLFQARCCFFYQHMIAH